MRAVAGHRGSSLLALALAICSATVAGEPASPQGTRRFTPPRLLERKLQSNFDSFYPNPRDREALVYVRVDLSATGGVEKTEVAEGGFHDPRFAAAAQRMAQRLRFAPAMEDGQPVPFQGVTIPIRFQLNVNRGVTPEFRKEALKVQKLIEDKDPAGAHFHAQWMMSEKVRFGFEFTVLQATMAHTYARTGEYHRALLASQQVTAHTGINSDIYEPGGPLPKVTLSDFILPREMLENMLRLRFALASSQGMFLDALRAHADMQALGMVAEGEPSMASFTRILDAVQTSSSQRAHVVIPESGSWKHPLWLHRFTVESVRGGAIGTIAIACSGYDRVVTYKPDVAWRIPERWSDCEATFQGAPNTEFDVLEFRPDQAQASASPPETAEPAQVQ